MDKLLLPGETVLMTLAANAQFGLDRTEAPPEILRDLEREPHLADMATKALIGVSQDRWRLSIGFKGAIAGQLTITNCRLHFESRSVNLFSGAFGIFISCITANKNDKGWISDQLMVRTRTAKCFIAIRQGEKLVAAGIPALAAAYSMPRRRLRPASNPAREASSICCS